jgi:Tol biopolymer transport system component
VTPDTGRSIQRFFDTSPFSPSGKYIAVFRLPYEDHLPQPGDAAEIVMIDLETGEEKTVADTRGWETQMGANLQWGADDDTLLFNDVDTSSWAPFAVKLDPHTGEKKKLGGCIYRVSPDGKKIMSANMTTMRKTQNGYGVVIPDDQIQQNPGLSDEDGFYITDTDTGESELFISIKETYERTASKEELKELEENWETYGFHCKWNAQGTRIMYSMRRFPKGEKSRFNMMKQQALRFDVFTCDGDGGNLYNAIPADQWDKGGHHTTWHPDGDRLTMNLNIERTGMYFCEVNYDGTNLKKIIEELPGSGHPTVHPNGIQIVTDTYTFEKVSFGDGTIPIRFVNLEKKTEETLIRIKTETEFQKEVCSSLRVDPHPAWDPTYTRIAFNGYADGTRRVYVADLTSVLV